MRNTAISSPSVRRGVWLGYLSTTGVYGDQSGGWVDETVPPAPEKRDARPVALEAERNGSD